MSRGVNKAIIVGNLGNDPEVRATASGARVATISVATSESWKDKNTGEQKTVTEWHRIVFFNRLAEIVEQYLTKGSQIYLEGRLQTRKWQDKDGVDRYTTEIVANEMQMLGGKLAGASSAPQGAPQEPPIAGQPPPDTGAPNIDFSDEIPFSPWIVLF